MRLVPAVLALAAIVADCLSTQAQAPRDAPVANAPDSLFVCVLANGQLIEVPVDVDPQSGDTTFQGRPLPEAYPSEPHAYLANAEWYVRDEMVHFEGRRYVRYGRPRVVRAAALTRVGEFRGIPLFAEDRAAATRFVYALVSPACDFQPYWYAATVGEVRGR